MPFVFILPFALFFTDGEMVLFWASNLQDWKAWTGALLQFIPEPLQKTRIPYCIRTKLNTFSTTLYANLELKTETELQEEEQQSD